jgi:hypothetical protein
MKCYGFLLLGMHIAVWEVRARNRRFRRVVAKNKDEVRDREAGETERDASV